MSDMAICNLCGRKHSEWHSIDRMYKSGGGLTPIHIIRDYLSGCIGGCEIASKATDEEIIVICDWKSEIAKLENELRYKKQLVKNIAGAIEKRQEK